MRRSLPITCALALSALLFAPPAVRAQDEGGLPTAGRPPARTPARPPRTVTTTRDPKRARASPATGDLSVASEPGALLELKPLSSSGAAKTLSRSIPAGERLFSFNDLKPGSYRVSARLEGFRPADETVTVSANKVTSLTLDLEPVTYDVVVTTNVRAGELRYAAGGDSPRVARIQNGRVALGGLRAGNYSVEIMPDEAGYERLKASFALPAPDDKYELRFDLERRLSTGTFFEGWLNLEGWDAPAGWRAESHRLLTGSAAGVALPRNEAYRYYADFKLVSDVKMLDDSGVSYALRAQDSRNYYLVQLTGAKADEPYVLRAYAVRDGVQRRLQPPISIIGNSDVLKAGKDLTVTFEFRDNRLAAFIRDNSVGEDLPLGIITDSERTFRKGAVGPASRGGERAAFSRFVVCDLQSCPKEQ